MGDNYPHVFPGQRACGAAKRWDAASPHRGATDGTTLGDTFLGTNRGTDGHVLTAYQRPNQSGVTADKHTHYRWVAAHEHAHYRWVTAHEHAHDCGDTIHQHTHYRDDTAHQHTHHHRASAYKHAYRGGYGHDTCLAPGNSKARSGADADACGRGWPVGDWDPSTARCGGDPAAAKHAAGSNDEQLFYRR